MANRLEIVTNSHENKEGSTKKNELNLGLQDYICDLLYKPVKEKHSSLQKTFTKNENISNSNDSTKDSKSNSKSIISEDNNDIEPVHSTNKRLASNKNSDQTKTFLEPDPRLKKVSKLLERIATLPLSNVKTEELLVDTSTIETELIEAKPIESVLVEADLVETDRVEEKKNELIQATNDNSFVQRENGSFRDSLDENFQTLIFDVNKLPLAVPLIKLGGIVNISNQQITPLVGTPDWFLGLVPNERGNLMVIDTQKFIMPERPVEDERTYDYLIVLDNSQWALACHNVGDAKNMHASDIRWASKSTKRPWFAGMVVEYMSALIEVDSLINQLAEQIVE